MQLDDAHIGYLTSHHQGRLATVTPSGNPQNKPVGYRYHARLGTIDRPPDPRPQRWRVNSG